MSSDSEQQETSKSKDPTGSFSYSHPFKNISITESDFEDRGQITNMVKNLQKTILWGRKSFKDRIIASTSPITGKNFAEFNRSVFCPVIELNNCIRENRGVDSKSLEMLTSALNKI